MYSSVPDEIIVRILYYIPPEETLSSFQYVSRRHARLAKEQLLWRYHCRTSFKHWDHSHCFRQKLALPVSEVDWKRLWILRCRENARVSELLDGILATKVGRLRRFEQICLLGYDAKDFLLEQCNTDDTAEDVLARRYYASAALGSIHRGVAIREWAVFQSPHAGPRRLDRALAGFDMFVLHDQEGDIDDVEALLDSYSRQFLASHPHFGELSTRRKALKLLGWVRSQNLTGMADPSANYRNIRNCLIGHALLDPDHESLPLISSAIYCSLAQRVGMRAGCCAFPAHVHVAVFAPSHETLDGLPLAEPPANPEMMYLDPYGSDREIHVEELHLRLDEYGSGWEGSGREAWLKASPTSLLVLRTAHNIRASYIRFQQTRPDPAEAARFALPSGDPVLNMESLLYAVLWVSLLLTPTTHQLWDGSLEHFLNRFRKYFLEDAWLLRKYLAPLYDEFLAAHSNPAQANATHRSGWEDVHLALQLEQSLDARPPVARRRDTWATKRGVRYHVGQVFVHRRYGTHGIVTGWHAEGARSLPRPDIGILPVGDMSGSDSSDGEGGAGGRAYMDELNKVYYTCMRIDVDRLIVAEDNMDIITDPDLVPGTLVRAAGKFFKRFDRETCTFVSNVKEMFPDD